jgi:hypothetical protein
MVSTRRRTLGSQSLVEAGRVFLPALALWRVPLHELSISLRARGSVDRGCSLVKDSGASAELLLRQEAFNDSVGEPERDRSFRAGVGFLRQGLIADGAKWLLPRGRRDHQGERLFLRSSARHPPARRYSALGPHRQPSRPYGHRRRRRLRQRSYLDRPGSDLSASIHPCRPRREVQLQLQNPRKLLPYEGLGACRRQRIAADLQRHDSPLQQHTNATSNTADVQRHAPPSK